MESVSGQRAAADIRGNYPLRVADETIYVSAQLLKDSGVAPTSRLYHVCVYGGGLPQLSDRILMQQRQPDQTRAMINAMAYWDDPEVDYLDMLSHRQLFELMKEAEFWGVTKIVDRIQPLFQRPTISKEKINTISYLVNMLVNVGSSLPDQDYSSNPPIAILKRWSTTFTRILLARDLTVEELIFNQAAKNQDGFLGRLAADLTMTKPKLAPRTVVADKAVQQDEAKGQPSSSDQATVAAVALTTVQQQAQAGADPREEGLFEILSHSILYALELF